MKKYIIILLVVLFSSCSVTLEPRTGYYTVIKVETTGQHQLIYLDGYFKPIELPLCNTYKCGDSVYLNFRRRIFLYK